MIQKNLMILALFFLSILNSCSKEDGPSTPPNTAPVMEARVFNVSTNISDTYVIGTITATDADKDDLLLFYLDKNSYDLFEITRQGELSLAPGKKLVSGKYSPHDLKVIVHDGSIGVNADVTINVTE
ncbi:cadherin repeat domain-containing protein [Flagellimonas marina]|uniref:Cadherin repeat domain-containing protein n=1 Tax=Flagellimonas marina TaxID=1775168 RepID=A0ABV8PMZ6_9FLAO